MPTQIPLRWALPTLRIFQKSNISPIPITYYLLPITLINE